MYVRFDISLIGAINALPFKYNEGIYLSTGGSQEHTLATIK